MSDEKLRAKKKAEQLIALACSTTFTEEARTAAVAAVQIIRAYKLELSINGGAQPPPWSPPPPRPQPPPWSPPPPRSDPWADVEGRPSYRPRPGEGKWIPSKYAGVCVACFERFAVNTWVLWHPDKGCMCQPCVDKRVTAR